MNKTDSLKKLELIDEKIAKLKAEASRIKSRASKQKRKDDTRRKILIGAYMIEQIEKGKYSKEILSAAMNVFLSRESDRTLFNLSPRDDLKTS